MNDAHPYAWANLPNGVRALFSDSIPMDEKLHFMREAILEAQGSRFHPTVGAIVVRDGEVVGRGHRDVLPISEIPPRFRVVHAEAAALAEAGEKASGATLYVTLEPCAGRGNGRRIELGELCSSLIPKRGISIVVVGLIDRDPGTAGRGLWRLAQQGIQLECAYAGIEGELTDLIGSGRFRVWPPNRTGPRP